MHFNSNFVVFVLRINHNIYSNFKCFHKFNINCHAINTFNTQSICNFSHIIYIHVFFLKNILKNIVSRIKCRSLCQTKYILLIVKMENFIFFTHWMSNNKKLMLSNISLSQYIRTISLIYGVYFIMSCISHIMYWIPVHIEWCSQWNYTKIIHQW